MCTVCRQVLTKTRRGRWIPLTGATGGYESPDVGSENQPWVLCFPLQEQRTVGDLFPYLQSMVLFYCYMFYISFSVCAHTHHGVCGEAGVQLAGVSVSQESNSCQARWQGFLPRVTSPTAPPMFSIDLPVSPLFQIRPSRALSFDGLKVGVTG